MRGRQPKVQWNPARHHFFCRMRVNNARRYFTLGKTLKEAEGELAKLLVRYKSRVVEVLPHSAGEVATIGDACKQYLTFKESDPRCSPEHFKGIKYHLKCLQEFTAPDDMPLGEVPITGARPEHLQSYLATQSARGWSPGYCRHAAGYAKAALRHAFRSGSISRNPWAIVQMPRADRKQRRVLTDAEVEELLEAAEGRDRVLLTLLYATGARPSEIAHARWENLQTDWIELQQHKTAHGTGKKRILWLSEQARSALATLSPKSKGLIFPNARGDVMRRWSIERIMRKAIQRMIESRLSSKTKQGRALEERFRDVTPYTLRHTRTTELIEAGADPKTVSEITGNSVVILLRDYVWPSPEHVKKALEAKRPKRISLLRVKILKKAELN